MRILRKGKGTQGSQQRGPHQSVPLPSAMGEPLIDDQVQHLLASASGSERDWGLGEKNKVSSKGRGIVWNQVYDLEEE